MGTTLEWVYVNDGYRGHGLGPAYRRRVVHPPAVHRQSEAGRDASDPAGAWRTAAAVGKRGQQELIDHLKAHRMGMGGMGNEYVGRNDPAHLLSNAVNTIPAVVGGRQLPDDQPARPNLLGRIEMGLPSTSTVPQTTNALGSREHNKMAPVLPSEHTETQGLQKLVSCLP